MLGERSPRAAEVRRSTAAQQVTACFGLPHAAILAGPPPCSYCCCCRGGLAAAAAAAAGRCSYCSPGRLGGAARGVTRYQAGRH